MDKREQEEETWQDDNNLNLNNSPEDTQHFIQPLIVQMCSGRVTYEILQSLPANVATVSNRSKPPHERR